MTNEATYFTAAESGVGRFVEGNDILPGGFGEVFDGVLSARRQEGYEAGYHRAINDLLADFVLISEEFIRSQAPGRPEIRAILRAFEDHLERSVGTSSNMDLMDGGLGI